MAKKQESADNLDKLSAKITVNCFRGTNEHIFNT